jgi:hypothetical protein
VIAINRVQIVCTHLLSCAALEYFGMRCRDGARTIFASARMRDITSEATGVLLRGPLPASIEKLSEFLASRDSVHIDRDRPDLSRSQVTQFDQLRS